MTRWRIMVGVVVALSVLALAGVVWGVLSTPDARPIRVCDGVGVARYSPPAVCDAHDLVWPRGSMPLRVGPSADATASAVDEVNRQIGVRLFRMAEPADVTVTLGVPYEARWHDTAATTWHDLGPRMTAEVRVTNVPELALLHAVLLHELGHVLGLDHDDAEDSIMFRSAGGTRFSDADRALLRRLYGEP